MIDFNFINRGNYFTYKSQVVEVMGVSGNIDLPFTITVKPVFREDVSYIYVDPKKLEPIELDAEWYEKLNLKKKVTNSFSVMSTDYSRGLGIDEGRYGLYFHFGHNIMATDTLFLHVHEAQNCLQSLWKTHIKILK